MHDGRAPPARVFTRQVEFRYVRMLFQNRVHRLAQLPNAFAMNDAHTQDSAKLTLRQIIRHEVLYFAWLKRVQIQHAIDRQLNRLVVHSRI